MIDRLIDALPAARVADRAGRAARRSRSRRAPGRGGTRRADRRRGPDPPTGMLDAISEGRRRSSSVRQRRGSGSPGAIRSRFIRGPSSAAAQSSSTKPGAAPIVMPTLLRSDPYIHFATRRRRAHRQGPAAARGRHDARSRRERRGPVQFFAGRLSDRAAAVAARPSRRGARHSERNFLPFIPWTARTRRRRRHFRACDDMEAVGINTPEELQVVEGYLAPAPATRAVDCDSRLQRGTIHRHAARSNRGRRSRAARSRERDHRRGRLLEGQDGGDCRAASTA